MPRSFGTYLLILFLLVLTGLTGYNYFFQPFLREDQTPRLPVRIEATPEPAQALNSSELAKQAFLARTIEQKVGSVIALPVTIDAPPAVASGSGQQSLLSEETLQFLDLYKPSVITLFGTDIDASQVVQLRGDLAARLGSDAPLLAVDYEGGRVARLTGDGFIRVPSWSQVCEMELQDRQVLFKQIALELKSAGISVVFGPVIDVGDTTISALGNRLCSMEPARVAGISKEFIAALKAERILPVVKHFPGIGGLTKDLHAQFVSADTNLGEIAVFKSVLEENPEIGVMIAHVGVNSQFKDVPCSLSPSCVGELTTLFPQVFTVSDGLDMRAARHATNSGGLKPLAQVASEAVMAPNNLLVFGEGVKITQMKLILDTLSAETTASEEFALQLEKSGTRVLERKAWYER